MKSYCGIGSRKTPASLKPIIKKIVEILNDKNYILRSGGANGADLFFEEHAKNKEIYLPWPNFNGNNSELDFVCKRAFKLASKFHPTWDSLKPSVKKLIARNGYQVLGKDLQDPVESVICWTPGGKITGGTAQAINIANFIHVPVFNLYSDAERALNFIKNEIPKNCTAL